MGALDIRPTSAKELAARDELRPLTSEEQAEVQRRMKVIDQIFKETGAAKYKLELMFGEARTMRAPVPGLVTFWESGAKLHGGGDARVYICPGASRRRNECSAVIPANLNGNGFLVCPVCGVSWKGTEVTGEVFGRHDMRHWADLLLLYFRRLEHNCDIYLKHSPKDIRTVAMVEQEKQKGGELLAKARNRALHIYPLRNIIKDTSAGADLLSRIYAFLTS